ncbi:glycosyltransferase family 2 protein [Candidatus Peregrinibacteria bacterium]|nr:glycosyltransferase family 2 protein [Candidatus Peregrinibacteria bacterium]
MNQRAKISVVIPTFNRAPTLSKTLDALHAQTLRDFEIILVDDGATDETREVVEGFQKIFAGGVHKKHGGEVSARFVEKFSGERKEIPDQVSLREPVRNDNSRDDGLLADSSLLYLHQKNQGQGIARNFAVAHAKAPITLFIGDDIIATPTFLAEHVRQHEAHLEENAAVLGFIDWHPDLALTPFMKWMTNGSCILGRYGGHQFAYEKLENRATAHRHMKFFRETRTTADYNFFYTSNISLKTSLLRRYPFDSAFQKYGWEDIELGYRLTQKENLVVYYAPQAKAFHYHPMDENSLAPRMRQIGASAHIIDHKYPELRKIPSRFKKIIFGFISSWPILVFFDMMRKILRWQAVHDYYYYALSKKYFLEGVERKPHAH